MPGPLNVAADALSKVDTHLLCCGWKRLTGIICRMIVEPVPARTWSHFLSAIELLLNIPLAIVSREKNRHFHFLPSAHGIPFRVNNTRLPTCPASAGMSTLAVCRRQNANA